MTISCCPPLHTSSKNYPTPLAGAKGGYSTVVVTGPIANSIPDLTLMYAVMANVKYPAADTCSSSKPSSVLPSVAAAAKAAQHEPRALGLPRALLPLRDKHSDGAAFIIEGMQPLKGLRIGIYQDVSLMKGSPGYAQCKLARKHAQLL